MKLIAASILCTSALIADSSTNPEGTSTQNTMSAGYNASAQRVLEGKTWQPNIEIDLSFLYYYAGEEGLDLANSASLLVGGPGGTVVVGATNSVQLNQDYKYKPAFKVGLGFENDEWMLHLGYTWIRQTNTTTSPTPPTPSVPTESGIWMTNNWFQQTTSVGQALSATNINSSWHLSMDLGDLVTGRPFYQSPYLVMKPFGGVRAAWIRQNLNMTITVPSTVVAVLTTSPIYSNNYSRSWALGPRVGCESSLDVGGGFSLTGNAALALLFTQYTTVQHSEQVASALANPTFLKTTLKNVNTLRPELDMGLGVNWGTTLCEDSCYLDFSANYNFLMFWNQNMMRKLVDQISDGLGAAPGNLFLQGLEIRGSVLF